MANYSLGEAVLGTTIDLKGLKKGLQAGEKESKGLFNKMGGVLQNALGVALGVGITQLPGLLMDIGKGVAGLVGDAAEVEQISKNFEALTASIGGTADALLQDLQQATAGMVSDADLMAAGNKLISMGLAESTEEAAKLTEMATQLGMAMGVDATQSMEDFALMLANQSIPRLDTFGISSGIVRNRIEELTKADKDLSKEQAFMQAVMEEGAKTMAKVGDQSLGTQASMEKIRATIENTKHEIGKAFLPVLDKLISAFAPLIEKVAPLVAEWIGILADWIGTQLPMAIDQLMLIWSTTWPVVQSVLEAVWNVVKPIFDQLLKFFQHDGPSSVGSFKSQVEGFLAPLIAFMHEQFGWIVNWVQENWPLIQEAVETVMAAVQKVIETVLAAVRKFWDSHGEKIMAIVDNMWTVIKTIFETVLKTIFDLVKAGLQLITGDTEGFKETMIGIWERLKEAIVTVVGALWDTVKTMFSLGVEFLGNIVNAIWDKVVEVGAKIVEGLRQGITNAWESFKQWLRQKIEDLLGGLFDFLGLGAEPAPPPAPPVPPPPGEMGGQSAGFGNVGFGGMLPALAGGGNGGGRTIIVNGTFGNERFRDDLIAAIVEAEFLTAG